MHRSLGIRFASFGGNNLVRLEWSVGSLPAMAKRYYRMNIFNNISRIVSNLSSLKKWNIFLLRCINLLLIEGTNRLVGSVNI